MTKNAETPINAADYIRDDSEVTRAACPTYHRKLTDKFIMLTMLEDEAPHLDTGDGDADAKAPKKRISFGKMGRDDQMKIINDPSFPANERENVLEHWKVWDEYHRETVEQCPDGQVRKKSHGVLLVSGGKDAVDEKADEWLANHKSKKSTAKRRRSSAEAGEQRSSILLFAMRAPSKLSDPDSAYIGWTDDEKKIAEDALNPEINGDVKALADIFFDKLADGDDCEVADCYAIRHDRDYRSPVWDPEGATYLETLPKDWHLHFYVHFKSRKKGLTVANLAKRLGIPEPQIEKNKVKGPHAWMTQCAYAIHALEPKKFQYAPDDVITLKGVDYKTLWCENRYKWEKAAKAKKLTQANDKQTLKALCHDIVEGKVTREQLELRDEYWLLYADPVAKRYIDSAFRSYVTRRMAEAVRALKAGEFTKSIIYIEGEAGSTKSEFAIGLCSFFKREYGWSATPSAAGKNSLDDYSGEEVLLLDDVRGQSMTAMDWLKLLDPLHSSQISARFYNKPEIAPRVIIITSPKSPIEFFHVPAGDEPEDQFIRRIMWRVRVFNPREYGFYNMQLFRPKPTNKAYDEEIIVGKDEFGLIITKTVSDLKWFFAPIPAMFSPSGAVADIIRDVDAQTGKKLDDDELECLCHKAAQCIYERYLNLMRKGYIPMQPGPDETTALKLEGVATETPTRYGLPGGPNVPLLLPEAVTANV